MSYILRRNGKVYLSNIRHSREAVAALQIGHLNESERETFQGAPAIGLLPKGCPIYRYGAVPQQAKSSSAQWVCFTEDWMEYSDHVVHNVALLDVVRPGAPRAPWNTAEWRAEFKSTENIVVWFGLAGPMAFDTSEGVRYLGPGDLLSDLIRHGGGSQVLIQQGSLSKIELVNLVSLGASRHLH